MPALQVAPADEVRATRLDDAARARTELGANLVFTGTVQQVGTVMRIDCTLVDTATSRQLRAKTVTASASDPFALQDRLLETALEMLGVPVAAANALYLQGRGYLQYYEKPENVESAIGAFDNALELDPKYARAYAGRGEAYWRKYESTKDPQWTAWATSISTRGAMPTRLKCSRRSSRWQRPLFRAASSQHPRSERGQRPETDRRAAW